jgi:hypothetical protein
MAEAMGRREIPAASASPIDPQLLAKVLADNMHLITNMGEYETISRPMAAKGSGLVAMAPLIESIVDLQPCAELPLSQLKNTLLQLVLDRPSWNSTRYRNDHYAGMRTERLMTLLHHVRRVVREPRRRAQLNLKLSGEEATRLDSILAKVQLRQTKGEEAGTQEADEEMPDDHVEPRTAGAEDSPMEAAGAEDSPMEAAGAEDKPRMLSRSQSLGETLELLQGSDLNETEKMELLKSLAHKDCKAKDTVQTAAKTEQKDTPKKQKPKKPKDTPKALPKKPKPKDTPKKQKPKKQTPEKDTSLKFVIMYYKHNNSFGVRHSGGGKQVLSVCKKGLAKPVLEDLAHKAKRSLEMGEDPLDTRCVVKLKLLELAKDLESGA